MRRRNDPWPRPRPALVPALALLLGLPACGTADQVLFQSLVSEEPEPPPTKAERQASVEQPPPLSAGYFRSAPVTMPRAGEGTVGDTLRGLGEQFQAISDDLDDRNAELQRIRAALAARTEDYLVDRQALVGETTADRTRKARIDLDLIYLEIDRLNALASKIGIDARSVGQLIATAREAALLEGATAEDQEQLALLEQQAETVEVTLHKMLGETHADISSQNAYANRQRAQLAEVAAALERGAVETARRLARRSGDGESEADEEAPAAPAPSAAPAQPSAEPAGTATETEQPAPESADGDAPTTEEAPASAGAAPPGEPAAAQEDSSAAQEPAAPQAEPAPEEEPAAPDPAGPETELAARPAAPEPPSDAEKGETRKPFVTIRFDRPDVDYAGPLYEAVRTAVERHPDVRFDVLALTAADEDGAAAAGSSGHARGVLATLLEMGIPAERVRVSAAAEEGLEADEVRIYVR